ncbi:hypothetical protein [Streptomyces sp. NBC_00443]
MSAVTGATGVQPEITDAVETITGTPARSFAQWAEGHADDFRH